MVYEVAVDDPAPVHVVPLSVLTWNEYPVMAEPPVSVGAVTETAMVVLPGSAAAMTGAPGGEVVVTAPAATTDE
jgi:hypothetical protein